MSSRDFIICLTVESEIGTNHQSEKCDFDTYVMVNHLESNMKKFHLKNKMKNLVVALVLNCI